MGPERKTSRRTMLAGVLRCTALGAMAAAGGAAGVKRQRLVAEGKCINDWICGSCAILAECGLPAALTVKQSGSRGDHDRAE